MALLTTEIKDEAIAHWESLRAQGVKAFWNFNIKKDYEAMNMQGRVCYKSYFNWYKEWGNSRFGAE
jgi:hypothetical protein